MKSVNRNVTFLVTKAKTHKIVKIAQNRYLVESGESGERYRVNMILGQGGVRFVCDCDWGKYRPSGDPSCVCSHTVAVAREVYGQYGYTFSVWSNLPQAKRQHKTIISVGDNAYATIGKKRR